MEYPFYSSLPPTAVQSPLLAVHECRQFQTFFLLDQFTSELAWLLQLHPLSFKMSKRRGKQPTLSLKLQPSNFVPEKEETRDYFSLDYKVKYFPPHSLFKREIYFGCSNGNYASYLFCEHGFLTPSAFQPPSKSLFMRRSGFYIELDGWHCILMILGTEYIKYWLTPPHFSWSFFKTWVKYAMSTP